MTSIYESIEKLKDDASEIRNEVRDLRVTLQQRNDMMMSLLKKQNMRQQYETSAGPFSRIFPVETVEDLEKYEKEINEENEDFNGLVKNLTNIISPDVVMATNMDGHYNKKRLLNYTKFIDIVFNACYEEDYTMKQFLGDFRRALRVAKNRCHKNNCVARHKLLRES